MTIEVAEKRCTKCGRVQPVSAFYITKGKPQSWCKACVSTSARKRQEKLAATEEGREVLRKRRRDSYARRGQTPSHHAWRAAQKQLIERHRREFDALYLIAYHEATRAEAGDTGDAA